MFSLFFVFSSAVLLSVFIYWVALKPRHVRRGINAKTIASDEVAEKSAYECIEPLSGFDWAATPPVQLRPFKPKYHLTMGVENMPLSDLVAMDSTYLNRIQHRKNIMANHFDSTVQCNPVASSAVFEFYTWLMTIYLPRRFPRVYELSDTSLYNKAKQTSMPSRPPPSPTDALRIIGENVDTDFLFLLPTPQDVPPNDNDQPAELYHLRAFVTCFPSGFSTLSKLNLPLSGIHGPVPGYKAKLEKSMDRFFARLPAGRCVRRSNWTVQTNDQLFCEAGNHLHNDTPVVGGEQENAKTLDTSAPGLEDEILRQRAEVQIENCRVRCERQTLHRLPQTGALVFAFKTYIYPLETIKAEGSGEALAEAIEGLGKGNVPEFQFYKRGVVWGEKVIQYLRS